MQVLEYKVSPSGAPKNDPKNTQKTQVKHPAKYLPACFFVLPAMGWVAVRHPLLAASVASIAISVVIIILLLDFSWWVETEKIGESDFNQALIYTHDLYYRVTIQVSSWGDHTKNGNVTSYFKRRITAWGDEIEVNVPISWVTADVHKNKWEKIITPPRYITCEDEKRRIFSHAMRLIRKPITGTIITCEYAGQYPIAKRINFFEIGR